MDDAEFAGGLKASWSPRCPRAGSGRLIAVGDSHVISYAKMFGRFASEFGMPAHSYHHPTCEFPSLAAPMAARPQCARFYRDMVAILSRTLSPGDILFMPSLRMPLLTGAGGRRFTAQQRDAAYREARSLLTRLSATGARLVFEAPKPLFRAAPYRCVDWFNRNNPACAGGFGIGRGEMLALRAQPLAAMAGLAREVPNLSIWDPLPILCPGDPCEAFRGDQALFHDEDHLTGYANDLLYPSFRRLVAPQSPPRQRPRPG